MGRGLKAQAWMGKGDLEKALAAFHERGDSINLWLCKGEIGKVLGHLEDAGDYVRIQRSEYRPRPLDLSEIYYGMGNDAMGLSYALKAVEFLENKKRESPGDFRIYNSLGLAYALAGNCERAANTGQIAVQMSPFSRDAFQDGPLTEFHMAKTYMLCGKYDEGIDLLEHLLTVPMGGGAGFHLSVGWLKHSYEFDRFMNIPRFQNILNSEYKTVY